MKNRNLIHFYFLWHEATANQEGGDASKPNGTSAAPTGVEDKQQPHS